MSSLKPITLYVHISGPNPWKTAIILEELGLPVDYKIIEFSELKQPPYVTEINPNGRVPAIIDPNTDTILWESGAINTYLVETYDKKHNISYESSRERHLVNQWLHFQVSGQGPYFGQAAWFSTFHAEKLPSAIERYQNEIERVIGVLNAHLEKQGTGYLVGDKCTYADLAFVTWSNLVPWLSGMSEGWKVDIEGKYPAYNKWINGLNERDSVKKVNETKEKLKAEKEGK